MVNSDACILLVARTPDVSIEELGALIEKIEGEGVIVAPLTAPIEYSMNAYKWSDELYDPSILIQFFYRKIGLENEVSLLVFAEEKRLSQQKIFCNHEIRSCIVSKDASNEELLAVVKSICSR
jgi:hypothetical protein